MVASLVTAARSLDTSGGAGKHRMGEEGNENSRRVRSTGPRPAGRKLKDKFRDPTLQLDIADPHLRKFLSVLAKSAIIAQTDALKAKAAVYKLFIVDRESETYKTLNEEFEAYVELQRSDPQSQLLQYPPYVFQWPRLIQHLSKADVGMANRKQMESLSATLADAEPDAVTVQCQGILVEKMFSSRTVKVWVAVQGNFMAGDVQTEIATSLINCMKQLGHTYRPGVPPPGHLVNTLTQYLELLE